MMDYKEACDLFSYDPETGVITNRVTRHYKALAGQEAGITHKGHGYRMIKVRQQGYLGHRVAWLLQTGEWPTEDIDHIDSDRSNNRWDNLRLATRSQNCWNRGVQKNNTSGIKGVSYDTSAYNKRWLAMVGSGRKRKKKRFATKEEAAAHVLLMREQLHADFARHA